MQVLKDNIKADIIDSARTLFIQKGYRETKMSDIARMAGISTSNLYRYFESKETIFYSITDRSAQRVVDMIDRYVCDCRLLEQDDFLSELFQEMYQLLSTERQNLLLILDGAQGSKHDTLYEELVSAVAGNFARLAGNDELESFIFRSISEHYILSIISILRQSKSDDEIYTNLQTILKYHIAGVKTLIG